MLAAGGQRHRFTCCAPRRRFRCAVLPVPSWIRGTVIKNPANLARSPRVVAVMAGPTGTGARTPAQGAPYLIAGKTGTRKRTSRKTDQQVDVSQLAFVRNQAPVRCFAPADAPASH